MRYTIQAACVCVTGKVRKNNEDNFYFDGKCLEMENSGLKSPVCVEDALKSGWTAAVFDGMGGENYGEAASFAAARQMQQTQRSLADYFVSPKNFLSRLAQQLNDAVVEKAGELRTQRMGTTMAALYFSGRSVYVCNVGDSRAYRLRDGEFLQLSQDHVEKRPGRENKKAPLNQYLGIDPEEMQIEPYIAKGDWNPGDEYLLCSDGLTDMLTNFEIADIMLRFEDPQECVQELVRAAMDQGGRDNTTVILCKIVKG